MPGSGAGWSIVRPTKHLADKVSFRYSSTCRIERLKRYSTSSILSIIPGSKGECPITPTYRLVDDLLRAKRDLLLENVLRHLDGFEVLILDDIGYVQQSRDEMEVLFTLLAERYERRSVIITSNLVFSQWDQIFKDPMTTAAAIDRVVHHSIIVEFGKEVSSHRAQEAAQRIQGEPID